MRSLEYALLPIIAAMLPVIALGQTGGQPMRTTLCELEKDPEGFNGKIVEFRAGFVSRFHWEGFVDGSCSVKLPIGVTYPLDDLSPEYEEYAFTTIAEGTDHPERLIWKPIPRIPIHLNKDESYRLLRKYADAKFRWTDGGVCQDCVLYRITVTARGRFEHFETNTVALRADPSAKAVVITAAPDTPLSRFLLEHVSDVTATPIDSSEYTAHLRRKISYEEASELLAKFLKLPTNCLLKSGDMGYTGFYYFMAILGASSHKVGEPGVLNVRYYAVDLQTADVWSSIICEEIGSRRLKTLQAVLRKRIGLTETEYRKVKREGPLCEPGYPRVTGK